VLAPVSWQPIGNTIRVLLSQGFKILLVRTELPLASTVEDRHYVSEHGQGST